MTSQSRPGAHGCRALCERGPSGAWCWAGVIVAPVVGAGTGPQPVRGRLCGAGVELNFAGGCWLCLHCGRSVTRVRGGVIKRIHAADTVCVDPWTKPPIAEAHGNPALSFLWEQRARPANAEFVATRWSRMTRNLHRDAGRVARCHLPPAQLSWRPLEQAAFIATDWQPQRPLSVVGEGPWLGAAWPVLAQC